MENHIPPPISFYITHCLHPGHPMLHHGHVHPGPMGPPGSYGKPHGNPQDQSLCQHCTLVMYSMAIPRYNSGLLMISSHHIP